MPAGLRKGPKGAQDRRERGAARRRQRLEGSHYGAPTRTFHCRGKPGGRPDEHYYVVFAAQNPCRGTSYGPMALVYRHGWTVSARRDRNSGPPPGKMKPSLGIFLEMQRTLSPIDPKAAPEPENCDDLLRPPDPGGIILE